MKTILIIFSYLALFGCSRSESIKPITKVEPLSSFISNEITLNYALSEEDDPIVVPEFFSDIQDEYLRFYAQELTSVIIENGEVDSEVFVSPITYYANELDEVDFEYVSKIGIKHLDVKVMSEEIEYGLEFINSIEVFLFLDDYSDLSQTDLKNIVSSSKDNIVLSYHKTKNKEKIHKIELRPVFDRNFKELLKDNRVFTLVTKVDVMAVPREELSLQGKLQFSISPKLPGESSGD